MIHVVAIITARPGQRQAVLDAFMANRPAVLAEQGCVEYAPLVDADGIGRPQTAIGADSFVVVEKWANVGSFKAHAAAPHMAAYAASVKDLLANRVIHVLAPTG